jgi:hypothetical protein
MTPKTSQCRPESVAIKLREACKNKGVLGKNGDSYHHGGKERAKKIAQKIGSRKHLWALGLEEL